VKHGSSSVRRSTARRYPRSTERGGGRRLGVTAAVGAVAVLLAVGLSGCGIRDTSLPVDAGDAAARTGCPPAPNATLTQLERDESFLPTGSATSVPQAAPPAGPLLWPPASGRAWAAASAAAGVRGTVRPGVGTAPEVVAAPSPNPSATESDGILSCLHVTGSATAEPTASATASP
jgi:hypothetical protein